MPRRRPRLLAMTYSASHPGRTDSAHVHAAPDLDGWLAGQAAQHTPRTSSRPPPSSKQQGPAPPGPNRPGAQTTPSCPEVRPGSPHCAQRPTRTRVTTRYVTASGATTATIGGGDASSRRGPSAAAPAPVAPAAHPAPAAPAAALGRFDASSDPVDRFRALGTPGVPGGPGGGHLRRARHLADRVLSPTSTRCAAASV